MKNTERFSKRVEDYIKYRPDYPEEFISFLYKSCGFSKNSIIADIGSGTGIMTKLLLEKGSRIIGVEPNKDMREAAEKSLMQYDNFTSCGGSAEATGLSSGSLDFIICAQAFHWFDRIAAGIEFKRILKPEGKLVLVWNNRQTCEDGFTAAYENLLKVYCNDYNDVNHKLITDTDLLLFFKAGTMNKQVFDNMQAFDFKGIQGRLLSSSYAPLPGERNFEPLMLELKKLFDKYNSDGYIDFKYKTEVYVGEL